MIGSPTKLLLFLGVVVAVFAVPVPSEDKDPTRCTYDNQDYKNQSTWVAQEAFKMKCVTSENGSWRTEVISCVVPAKMRHCKDQKGCEDLHINVNDKKDDGQDMFECVSGNNQQVNLKHSKAAKADCKNHKYGTTWREGFFRYKCQEGGVIKLEACITAENSEIPLGETLKMDMYDISCTMDDNGVVSMKSKSDSSRVVCKTSEGVNKKFGEKWNDKSFVKKCSDYGVTRIVACRDDSVEEEIPVGKNVTVNGKTFSCYKNESSFALRRTWCEHAGIKYDNQSYWFDQDVFKYKCELTPNRTMGAIIVGCKTPSGKEIAIGETVEIGDTAFECTKGNVTLRSGPVKNALCLRKYKTGEEWTDGTFKMRCEPHGKTSAVACMAWNNTEISVGESKRLDGITMECASENGKVILRPKMGADCVAEDGSIKKSGDIWHEKAFVRRCSEYGYNDVIACKSGDLEIAVNTTVTTDGVQHICENKGKTFRYGHQKQAPLPS
ncbi:unnamed protein product [Caenorhabditis auriculariae]|uniref:Abnormal cell migration protein 18-like fibronectin type I domain-containing protein n=1 Tax=Caenorhabditis auriculariae TaxID=2777116 RepID=A0A8S1HHF4_9PELO|nr:unnamed protein product [Caenorhabditis auriculariae]